MFFTTLRNKLKVNLGGTALFNNHWRDDSLAEIDSLYEIANAELMNDQALYRFFVLNPNNVRALTERLIYEVKKIANRDFAAWMTTLHPNVCHRVADRLLVDLRGAWLSHH